MLMYYEDKISLLEKIFGGKVSLDGDIITCLGKTYRVKDDVIHIGSELSDAATDIQKSFGDEWTEFDSIDQVHYQEFNQYFDLVKLDDLNGVGVCDLGCGMGRWSRILLERCTPKYLICIDFSDAIYVARNNLRDHEGIIYIKADILNLPFESKIADFMFSLGVLHHTTSNALSAVRRLSNLSDSFLVYLYYNMDNRGYIYKSLFHLVNVSRVILCSIQNKKIRHILSYIIAITIYKPMVYIGNIFEIFGGGHLIPLYDFYHAKSIKRIAQDAYDRFFTSIEQRFSRKEILELSDTYSKISVSQHIPYWHFLCEYINNTDRK